MSPVRPDIVECWIFRVPQPARIELLLIRRADDRIFPGIWQPVTGGVEAGESVPRAALREVQEETGLGPADVEAFYDLDQVGAFFAEDVDAVAVSVFFALRVRVGAEPRVSPEHVGLEWVDRGEAERRSIWPAYRDALELIERIAANPELARWFELDPEGRRSARAPR